MNSKISDTTRTVCQWIDQHFYRAPLNGKLLPVRIFRAGMRLAGQTVTEDSLAYFQDSKLVALVPCEKVIMDNSIAL